MDKYKKIKADEEEKAKQKKFEESPENNQSENKFKIEEEMFADNRKTAVEDNSAGKGDKADHKDDVLSKHIKHPPLKYGKKLYIGEFIAEKVIQMIAFMSITIIIAIFYYVFQESIYAFVHADEIVFNQGEVIDAPQLDPLEPDAYGEKEEYAPQSYNANPGDELAPETYGAEPDEVLAPESYSANTDEALAPETYGAEPDEVLAPETYGADTDENLMPQSYGDPTDELIQPHRGQVSELELNEETVNASDLIAPNALVNDEKTYVWQPISQEPKYSFIPLAMGALKVTLIGLFIAAPIAILAALYTVAFSPRWIREVIKPAIEILAGFPSIVIGFFALMTLATVIQDLFDVTYRLNAFVGGVGMSLAVIPIIYTVAEDALSSIPKSMKEASLALGASRWQTAYKVVLPAATPGVFAAIILGFGRAFGETMIALMATGNAALVTFDLFDSVRTMSATIGAEMAEVEFRSVHYGVLFLIGSVLFVITFGLNALAEFYVRKRLLKRIQGK